VRAHGKVFVCLGMHHWGLGTSLGSLLQGQFEEMRGAKVHCLTHWVGSMGAIIYSPPWAGATVRHGRVLCLDVCIVGGLGTSLSSLLRSVREKYEGLKLRASLTR
jgi:hypothetical protein